MHTPLAFLCFLSSSFAKKRAKFEHCYLGFCVQVHGIVSVFGTKNCLAVTFQAIKQPTIARAAILSSNFTTDLALKERVESTRPCAETSPSHHSRASSSPSSVYGGNLAQAKSFEFSPSKDRGQRFDSPEFRFPHRRAGSMSGGESLGSSENSRPSASSRYMLVSVKLPAVGRGLGS